MEAASLTQVGLLMARSVARFQGWPVRGLMFPAGAEVAAGVKLWVDLRTESRTELAGDGGRETRAAAGDVPARAAYACGVSAGAKWRNRLSCLVKEGAVDPPAGQQSVKPLRSGNEVARREREMVP